MDRLAVVRSKHRDFLHEASENYSLQTYGQSSGPSQDAFHLLTQAYDQMLYAVVAVERAQPFEISTPTKPEARRILFRKIRKALTDSGLDCSLSSGYRLEEFPAAPSEADLTPFEQLVNALGIHDADTPRAASKWMQRAAAGTE